MQAQDVDTMLGRVAAGLAQRQTLLEQQYAISSQLLLSLEMGVLTVLYQLPELDHQSIDNDTALLGCVIQELMQDKQQMGAAAMSLLERNASLFCTAMQILTPAVTYQQAVYEEIKSDAELLAAVLPLWLQADWCVERLLADKLDEHENDVVRTVATSIYLHGGACAADDLWLRLQASDDLVVQQLYCWALYCVSDARSREAMQLLLSGEQHASSLTLAALMGEYDALAPLQLQLKAGESWAARALAWFGKPVVADVLLAALDSAHTLPIAAEAWYWLTGQHLPSRPRLSLVGDAVAQTQTTGRVPDATAAHEWWQRNGNWSTQTRYLLGKPLSQTQTMYALRHWSGQVVTALQQLHGLQLGRPLQMVTADSWQYQRQQLLC